MGAPDKQDPVYVKKATEFATKLRLMGLIYVSSILNTQNFVTLHRSAHSEQRLRRFSP